MSPVVLFVLLLLCLLFGMAFGATIEREFGRRRADEAQRLSNVAYQRELATWHENEANKARVAALSEDLVQILALLQSCGSAQEYEDDPDEERSDA